MRRLGWILLGVLASASALGLALAASEADSTAAAARTDLRITVWPKGKRGSSRTWTLRCEPVGGTLPNRERACRQLASVRDAFRPVPRDAICTQVYGGPAVARVEGRFRGRRVAASFKRTDGCEIARWNRHGLLFPVRV